MATGCEPCRWMRKLPITGAHRSVGRPRHTDLCSSPALASSRRGVSLTRRRRCGYLALFGRRRRPLFPRIPPSSSAPGTRHRRGAPRESAAPLAEHDREAAPAMQWLTTCAPNPGSDSPRSASTISDGPGSAKCGTPQKPQVHDVTGPITFTNLPFTTRRQHIFLLLFLDVRTGRGTVRGRRAREKIRRHDFDRIAVLGEAE